MFPQLRLVRIYKDFVFWIYPVVCILGILWFITKDFWCYSCTPHPVLVWSRVFLEDSSELHFVLGGVGQVSHWVCYCLVFLFWFWVFFFLFFCGVNWTWTLGLLKGAFERLECVRSLAVNHQEIHGCALLPLAHKSDHWECWCKWRLKPQEVFFPWNCGIVHCMWLWYIHWVSIPGNLFFPRGKFIRILLPFFSSIEEPISGWW